MKNVTQFSLEIRVKSDLLRFEKNNREAYARNVERNCKELSTGFLTKLYIIRIMKTGQSMQLFRALPHQFVNMLQN